MSNEYAINFKETLKVKRRSMGAGNRKKTKNLKSPNWLYPTAQENRYFLEMMKLIRKPLVDIVNANLQMNLSEWIEEKKRNDEIRKDSWIDEIRELLNTLRKKATEFLGADGDTPESTIVWETILLIAGAVYTFNKKQWGKVTSAILGFEYFTDDGWWDDVFKAWSEENFNFFKDLTSDYINSINETVYRGIRNGMSYKEIMKDIRGIDHKVFSKKRAKLIARDQVGKLNGQITKKRMTEAGLNLYIWMTALDERVRGRPGGRYPKANPSHWLMENKLCKWDNNYVYAEISEIEKGKISWKPRTGKMPKAIPGEEIQCRCGATPYYSELIDEMDKEIDQEKGGNI